MTNTAIKNPSFLSLSVTLCVCVCEKFYSPKTSGMEVEHPSDPNYSLGPPPLFPSCLLYSGDVPLLAAVGLEAGV